MVTDPHDAASRATVETHLLAPALLLLFMIQSLNGLGFLGGEGQLDRFLPIMLAAIAALILLPRWPEALATAVRAWPLFAVVGFCGLSVLWSEHPEHTMRRVAFLVLSVFTALALAVGFGAFRRLHAAMLAAFAAIILANLFAAVVLPGFAFTEIGFRGLHLSKNMAGITAMAAFGCAAAWIYGARRASGLAAGLAVAAAAAWLLVLTESKTSLALALVTTVAGTGLVVLWRAGPLLGGAGALAAGFGVAASVVAIGVADWSRADVFTALVGDPTFSRRTDIWDFVSVAVAERPLLGFGYGAYWDVGAQDDPLRSASPGGWLGQVEIGVINQAHNGYLDLALQIGVPATAAAVLALIFWTLRAFALAADPAAPRDERGPRMLCLLLMLQFVSHNQMEASLLSRTIPYGGFMIIVIFASLTMTLSRPRPVPAVEPAWEVVR